MAGRRRKLNSRSLLKTEVNLRIREAAESFQIGGTDGTAWTFVCECSDPSCDEIVEITLSDYEALLAEDRAILVPGHTASRARAVRREARMRVDEARALSAQAKQQRERARRNVELADELSRDEEPSEGG